MNGVLKNRQSEKISDFLALFTPKGLFVLGEEEWYQTTDYETVPKVLQDAGFRFLYMEPEYDYHTVLQIP